MPAGERFSNAALLDRCRAGDPAAWEEVVRRFGRLVYSVPRRLFGLSLEDAQEVHQETFLAFLQDLDSIRAEAISTWLFRAAVLRSKHLLRKARCRGRLLRSLDDVGGEHAVLRGYSLEEIAAVESALAELDPTCREILSLRYLEKPQLSYREIAGRLGLAMGSLGPLKARCLKKLLQEVRRHDDEKPVLQ